MTFIKFIILFQSNHLQNLFSALLRGNYPEAVQFIVMGADLGWSNIIDSRKSLCHYVVEDSNVIGLWLLVLNDAPLTLQDAHGNTPLHYAANLALPECVRVLLSVLLQSEVETKNSNRKCGSENIVNLIMPQIL
jgi:ankyrin repeat protein